MVRPQSVLDAVPIQSLESAKLYLNDRPHCRREVRAPREPLALTAALALASLVLREGEKEEEPYLHRSPANPLRSHPHR